MQDCNKHGIEALPLENYHYCMLLSANVNIQMIWAWFICNKPQAESSAQGLITKLHGKPLKKGASLFLHMIMIYTWHSVFYWKCISRGV